MTVKLIGSLGYMYGEGRAGLPWSDVNDTVLVDRKYKSIGKRMIVCCGAS